MALPTGQIGLNQVNVELGKASTATISLGDADVRSLAGKTSGQINMSDLQGKSSFASQHALSIGYVPEGGDSKSPAAELRGYWNNVDGLSGSGVGGSLSPLILSGYTLRGVHSQYSTFYENSISFRVIIAGHSVPQFLFNGVDILIGTSTQRSFLTSAASFLRVLSYPNGVETPFTIWDWPVAANNVFPTFGNRTIGFR